MSATDSLERAVPSSTQILVRTFEDRDVAPACALANHYIEHTAIHFGYRPDTESQFRAMWLEGREKYPWLAAEISGAFAGYAKCGSWRTRDAYALTAETGIYVARDLQGRGIGRALYVELIARARAAGFHLLTAGVTLPNEGSVKLHEAVGFRYVGTFQEAGRKFDQWHDVGFWQLPLS